jgi:Asp-tRNA(Asn)/Glu-tRNA(Gln) amidotransferase A subunit family amidase
MNNAEIGMDTSNCNPNYGSPINPYNNMYYTGGSSGGSASAVAAGLMPFALGCDGGGSIRIPSSWCGLYGLKTSHGWVSARPYESRAKSTAVTGPMAANMLDLEIAWRVMAQPDPDDATSRQFPIPVRQEISWPKRIGIYKTWFDRADPVIKATCQKAVDYFKEQLGYEIIDMTIPYLKEAQMAHALTILNEATSTVKKFDLKKLTPPNQILLHVGRSASCADFLAALRIRTMVMEHLAFLFKKHPGLIIITPTTPNAGWPIHKKDAKYGTSDGNRSIRNMEYVWLANFAGIPSITIPVGYVDPVQGKGKLPVGLMGAGEWGSEDQLIDFGYEGEKYLNGVLDGARLKPSAFVDVLGLAEVKKEETASAVEKVEEERVERALEKEKVVKEEQAAIEEKATQGVKSLEKEKADKEEKAGKEVEDVNEKVAEEIDGAT